MFEVGQVVFCPKRGSGVIEAIETRTMMNEEKEYNIIQMKDPKILMMIPTDRMSASGFRTINSEKAVMELENILKVEASEIEYSTDIKQRLKDNQEKLSNGSFIACGEVVRDLTYIEQIKALNNAEKNMLGQAKKLLLDEFSIIKNVTTEEAEQMLNRLLSK